MTRKTILFIFLVTLLSMSIALPASAAVTNPPLEPGCSLNVIFVLDESGSIYGAGGAAGITSEVRNAANGFLDALADTGSTVAIVEFSTTARNPIGYTPLTSSNVTNILTPYINGIGATPDERYNPSDYDENSTPSYYTNWEDALDMVASINAAGPIADMVVFFTDGNPTAHNDPNGPGQIIDADNISSHLPFGEVVADAVKSQGSHMFAVGLPNPTLTEENLWTISGPIQYPDDTLDLSSADYSVTTSTDLEDALREIAFALCTGSVSISKTIYDGHDYINVPGWQFSGTVTVTEGGNPDDYDWIVPEPAGPATELGMTKIGTTDADGTFTWQWKPHDTYPTQIELNESESGVSFDVAQCTRYRSGEPDEHFQVDALPIVVSFGLDDFVTCEFRNNADGVDWGDAQDSYKTDAASQGARHIIMPGASILGSTVDAESNGLPSLMTDGDDYDQIPDDEDGVTVPADAIWNDGQGEINVTANGPGCLNAWIDFNNVTNTYVPNGSFEDPGEHVITNTVVLTGTMLQEFPLPENEIHDVSLVMRFRITPLVDELCYDSWYQGQSPSPYGAAVGGEVEDHIRGFGPTAIDLLSVWAMTRQTLVPFVAFTILLAVSTLGFVLYRRNPAEEQ
ncbi:MAG: vWA domain-containing protein [Candidatus Promineifilaceae bacterium]